MIDGNDTLTFAAGAGITVLVGGTDTVTYSAVLGSTIDSSEIENGTITADDTGTASVDSDEIAANAVTTAEIDDATITFGDIAQNACSTGQFMGWDGSAWVCSNPIGPTAQVYSGQTTDINTVGYTAVPFDNETIKESGITHSNVTNNTRVTIDTAGTYFVSYSISWVNGDTNRKNIECGIRVNGSTMITPSLAYGYSRTNTEQNGTVSSSAVVTTASDNDYYEIVCQSVGGAGIANLVANQAWTIVSSTTTGVGNGGGGGSSAFDITDSSNTETVNGGETLTFASGAGLSVLVSGPDTVTFSSDLGADIASAEIVNATILFEDIAANGCSSGEVMEYSGAAWICGTDDGLTSEVDGIVGNEVLDVTVNGGLTRAGLGTGASPYTLGLRTDCSANEFLSWNGSAWGCNVPVYEKIVLWAEDNGTASAADTGGDEYSFGNGSVGSIGITLAEDWELYAVSFDAETFGTSVDVDVVNRNGGAVLHSFTANADDYSETIGSPVSVSAGDVIGFTTTNTVGATTDIRAAVYLRRLP